MDDKLELVDDPNIVDGGNFAIKRNGKEYWVSRSNTISLCVFGYDENGVLHVLASKRGPKARGGVGKWNIIAGFLDYGYTLEQTAIKECYEETGVKITEDELINFGTHSNRVYNEVSTRFMAILKDPIENHPTSIENCEPGEVTDAQWIAIDNLDKYIFWYTQKNTILELANRLSKKNNLDNSGLFQEFSKSLNNLLSNGVINDAEYKQIMNIVKN